MKPENKQLIQPMIDDGVLKLVGTTDFFEVYNLADVVYTVIWDHTAKAKDQKDNLIGVMTGAGIVKNMIEYGYGDSEFKRYYDNLTSEEKHKNTILLGPSNYKFFKGWKDKTDIQGPTTAIDIEMEERLGIREKSKSR